MAAMTLSRGAYAFRRLSSARALYDELHGTTVPGTSLAADTVLTVRGADAAVFKAALLQDGADVHGIVVKLIGEGAPIAGEEATEKAKEKEEAKSEVIDTSADVDGVVFGGTTLFRFRSARATGGAGSAAVDGARIDGARIDGARIDDALKDKWFMTLPAPRGHLAFVADSDLATLLWVHVSPAARATLSLDLAERFSHCGSLTDARTALRDFRGRWLRAPKVDKDKGKKAKDKKKATAVGGEADEEGWTTVARR